MNHPNDTSTMLVDAATRLFSTLCTHANLTAAETSDLPLQLWQEVESMGLPAMMASERDGGIGASPQDAIAIMRVAGRHSLPLPLAESVLARWLLSRAQLQAPPGPIAVVLGTVGRPWHIRRGKGADTVKGTQGGVPWAADAKAVLVVTESRDGGIELGLVPPSRLRIERGRSMASEPRDHIVADDVALDASAVLPGLSIDTALGMAALLRAGMMTGALEQILDMSLRYVGERTQFGRPLSKFQAVQQQLSVLAGDVAASSAITEAAAAVIFQGDGMLMVAAARARLADAIDRGAGIAHQVHGAMGFVRDYPLHFSTRRLWGWRDEYCSAAQWRERLGRAFAGVPAEQLWPRLASLGSVR